MEKPCYFEEVREQATQLWEVLEQNPRLQGPVNLLFDQIQNPRYVLSELLQNADDAGATEATAWIETGTFYFEHNGEDFTKEHFQSLCDFGNSNKRNLHTIGFRGIGFKSTFSLGDCVEVYSPTLSVCFDRQRFYEPRWVGNGYSLDGTTRIRIAIKNEFCQQVLENSLEEWLKSPISLLFFKHIRRLRVMNSDIHWQSKGAGSVPNSEWMTLDDGNCQDYLLIRSQAQEFPEDALAEIRQVRMVTDQDEADLPPCTVDVVLGAEGRLYVVLPTGVETSLPFACNAPFIQDPARLKIKEPQTSPTNRWLLKRAGELAANSMLAWLQKTDITDTERAGAYDLLPQISDDGNSIECVCGRIVEESFESTIDGECFLLTDDGGLVEQNECVALPEQIRDVWHPNQAAELFDEKRRLAFSRHVSNASLQKLLEKHFLTQVSSRDILTALKEQSLPQPESWDHLLMLWAYVADYSYYPSLELEQLHIVPVEGMETLNPANDVVRISENRLLESEEDWRFFSVYISVLDHNWLEFIKNTKIEAEENNDSTLLKTVDSVYTVLKKIGMDDSTSVSGIIHHAASKLFTKDNPSFEDCLRLTQIAARFGVKVEKNYRYFTRDGSLRSPENVICDPDSCIEELIPESRRESVLLHRGYTEAYTECTLEEWIKWLKSGRSGLLRIPALVEKTIDINSREAVIDEVKKRGGKYWQFSYRRSIFELVEWDFEDVYWDHWKEIANTNKYIWATLVEGMMVQAELFLKYARAVKALQYSQQYNAKSVTDDQLLASWILRLRELPCLRDTRGFCRKPAELLRHTRETDALMDVEAFVDFDLDTEANRPFLDLLGVGSKPTGPERILSYLRSLALSEKPPLHEVERWYRRLDQMADSCVYSLNNVFRSEKLILTNTGIWADTSSVFIEADEDDLPGIMLIRDSVRDLSLWRKIGVAERPSADQAIRWLKELPLDEKVPTEKAKLVDSMLRRYAIRVWNECEAWINLAGEWKSTSSLNYSLSMRSLIPWSNLQEWVKQQTADFRALPANLTLAPPFSGIPTLASLIEERFDQNPNLAHKTEERQWLKTFGAELSRIELDTPAETDRIRALAKRLSNTRWQRTSELKVTPYLNGKPAGVPWTTEAVWLEFTLFVSDKLPKAKLAKCVPEEIAKVFSPFDIEKALSYSFERSAEDVREYLEENFKLVAAPAQKPLSDSIAVEARKLAARLQVFQETAGNDTEENDVVLLDIDDLDFGSIDNQIKKPTASRPVSGASQASPPRQSRPGIIERFTAAQGFSKDGDGRYYNQDGEWISKTSGERFPWQRRTASGDLVCYYMPREHCLEDKPLVIEADVWGLLESQPDKYSLILEDSFGHPKELTGHYLRGLLDQNMLGLYPASYRIAVKGTH